MFGTKCEGLSVWTKCEEMRANGNFVVAPSNRYNVGALKVETFDGIIDINRRKI